MNYEQVMYAAFQDELIKQAGIHPAIYNALSAPQHAAAGLLAKGITGTGKAIARGAKATGSAIHNGINTVGDAVVSGVPKAKNLMYDPKIVEAFEVAQHGGGQPLPTLFAAAGHYGGHGLKQLGHVADAPVLHSAGHFLHGLGGAVAHTLHSAH
jgi:hypothetical protein